jgi:hypothetical protein
MPRRQSRRAPYAFPRRRCSKPTPTLEDPLVEVADRVGLLDPLQLERLVLLEELAAVELWRSQSPGSRHPPGSCPGAPRRCHGRVLSRIRSGLPGGGRGLGHWSDPGSSADPGAAATGPHRRSRARARAARPSGRRPAPGRSSSAQAWNGVGALPRRVPRSMHRLPRVGDADAVPNATASSSAVAPTTSASATAKTKATSLG